MSWSKTEPRTLIGALILAVLGPSSGIADPNPIQPLSVAAIKATSTAGWVASSTVVG